MQMPTVMGMDEMKVTVTVAMPNRLRWWLGIALFRLGARVMGFSGCDFVDTAASEPR